MYVCTAEAEFQARDWKERCLFIDCWGTWRICVKEFAKCILWIKAK